MHIYIAKDMLLFSYAHILGLIWRHTSLTITLLCIDRESSTEQTSTREMRKGGEASCLKQGGFDTTKRIHNGMICIMLLDDE